MLKRQKIIKNKQKSIVKHLAKISGGHWLFYAATILVAFLTWLTLSISKMANRGVSGLIDLSPDFIDSPFIPAFLAALFLIAASIYFYIDYKQHLRPFAVEGLGKTYAPLHHARKVLMPKMIYGWKHTLYLLSYGVVVFIAFASIVTVNIQPVSAYAPNEFVTTWKTDNIAPANEVTITTSTDGGLYSYNYTVDWGDGSVTTGHTGDATHAYSSAGTYTVKITGDFPRPANGCNSFGSPGDLLSIEQWGNNQWKTMEYAFMFCGAISVNATDAPDLSQVTSMAGMFREVSMNNDISHWDVSTITNMNGLFAYNHTFNQPLNSWNVSNVTDMGSMFLDATVFNQPLNSWNVSNVTDMSYMFGVASSFNQPLDNWDTSKVTTMQNMFSWGPFNQNISTWNTSSVTDMSGMFALNTVFNQPLNSWNVSNVTDMGGMFGRSIAFNQPLNNWNTSSVTDMSGMFMGAQGFNQSLGSWDVSSVTTMDGMFGTYISSAGLNAYNYDSTLLGWSTLNLQNNVTFVAGTSTYCAAGAARLSITSAYSWTISDAGVNCSGSSTAPFVSTVSATVNSSTSATLQGEVIADGGSSLTAAGFQYSTDISFSQDTGSVTTAVGSYSHPITSLSCGTKYYYRAYATNGVGTAYGMNKTFTTAGCPFITKWKTDNTGYGSSASNQVTIPTTGGGYNYTVDWGDGNTSTGVTGNITHTYSTPGTYDIEINGDFPRIYCFTNYPGGWDCYHKLLSVEQWGDIQWSSMSSAFEGARYLQINATDAPDLSGVTDMSSMFSGATAMNSDISHWDVSNVTKMGSMFSTAYSFNQSINDWDVSNVTEMGGMFFAAHDFNQPLDQWDVSSVNSTSAMFLVADSFNQPLNSWTTSSITNMSRMFEGADAFNRDISGWDVSNVTNMYAMFKDNDGYNQDMPSWDTGSVTTMYQMFYGALAFNGDVTGWDTSSVTTMGQMFYRASSFNQDISSWNTSNVTDLSSMFAHASSFNQDISSWDTGNVTDMHAVFNQASSFNQPLNSWDVSSVNDMSVMFASTPLFNQPLGSWDTSNVTTMSSMFSGATAFDQNINTWDVSNVLYMSSMFSNTTSFNQPLNSWDVSSVTRMGGMFLQATAFSQPLNNWDISGLSGSDAVSNMFYGATAFNQDVSSWDVSGITNFYRMFINASSFNQSLAAWDVSSAQTMTGMLTGTALSTANYDDTLIGWSAQTLQNSVSFGAAPANYCTAEANRQNIINTFGWNITDGGLDCNDAFADGFITTWKTDNPGGSDGNQIKIPTAGLGYNYSVDWGDGNVDTGLTDTTTHTYTEPGTYTVKIIGDFPRICFAYNSVGCPNGDDRGKILTVEQWGDIHWSSMSHAFWSVANLEIPATDAPDLSGVNDMSAMFANSNQFNANIDHWDVSNVTEMDNLFAGATSFNQPLNSWDVSGVTSLSAMFAGATSFNQPLNQWDTSSATDMSMMFWQAEAFNQPIGSWNVSAVLSMLNMFNDATVFDQNINNWDTSSVQVMHGMFRDATSFNQPLNNWDTSSVLFMADMFANATSFDQNISSWNVNSVTEMDNLFAGATSFNQPLNSWGTSSVTSLSAMFAGATSFNQPLDQWDISSVTHPYGLAYMFYLATSFNQPLNSWDTSSVENMNYMFMGATSFNQPLNNWDTSSVEYMGLMFAGATSFDQSLASWNIGQVKDMSDMFLAESYGPLLFNGLSIANYDDTLASWSLQSLQNNVVFDAGISTYCDAADERQSIITDFNWVINDYGNDCTNAFKEVTTQSPSNQSSTQATLNGSVSGPGGGNITSGGFEWGTSESYGNEIDGLAISGGNFSHGGAFICGIQYHYRAFGLDGANQKTYGDNTTFTLTCPQVPAVNKAPTISIKSPKDGQYFVKNENITLSVEASDVDGSVKEVRFYLNGKLLGISYKKPYTLIVQASQLGQFNFVAVADDNDGASTATESIEFSITPAAPQILKPVKNEPSEPDEEPKAVLDISKDWDEPIVFGGSLYKPVPLVAKITRNLPWTLLLAMAAAYAWQAYRQMRQNRLLKQGLSLTNQVRENMESFLHIVTHYLGTSATLIGLAAESLGRTESPTSTKGVFVTVADNFKKYVNNLISVLNVQATDIKEELSSGGKIQRYSTRRWVIIPIAAGSALTLISTFGLSGVGLWQTEMLTLVFNTILAIGSGLLVFIFFRTWQNQRQLKADLVSTIRLSENALEARRSVIQKNQKEISAHLALVDRQASLIDDPTFKKRVQAGLSQLRQVEEGFNRVVQLTAAVAARTTRAYIPINQITERLAGKAKEKHVDLNVKIAPSTTTRLLPEELDHVLTTLVSNAVEFTPEGGHVDVRADNKGTALSVSVKDTGVGIPKEKIPTLMQPFARATSTETYDYSGLGLNLYITRLIAEKYGGSVRIKSDKNKGALIEVKI